MRKLICAAAVSLCTMPAIAAGPLNNAVSRLGNPGAAGSNGASNPLPPLQLESSLTVPGFGSPSNPQINAIVVPGVASIAPAYKNQGAGQPAKLSDTVTLNPSSGKTPTAVSTDAAVTSSHQLVGSLGYHGAGYGGASHSGPNTTSLPLGTLTSSTNNNGQGDTLDSVLTYTSPAVGQK